MTYPKLVFSVQPHNDSHVILEISGSEGSWQVPIEKEQAMILSQDLAQQAQKMPGKHHLISTFLRESMVRLPAGTLWMGSMPDENVPEDELPRHQVQIESPFFLCSLLVTQGLYRSLMGENPSSDVGAKKPVSEVTWYEAIAFCNALSEKEGLQPAYKTMNGLMEWDKTANGYRLPTEAEWEYAARTQDDLYFSGSDNMEAVAWCTENATQLEPVAQKSSNEWGIFDLSGLVFEWCWDDYAPYQQTTSAVGASQQQKEKVCRGGSWKHSSRYAKPTARYSAFPQHRGMIGIRLARNAE